MLLDIASHRVGKSAGRIRQKNEQLILSAAEMEFARSGFKGATMNSIADLAGLPKSNIHYYFKNKLQLYAEVLSNIIDLWDSALNELRADEEPAVALRAYIATKIRFACEYPLASRVFAKEILSGAPILEDYFNEGYKKWFDSKTDVFRQWARQGKIDPIEPAHIIFLIWSSTQHYADFAVQIAAALGRPEIEQQDYDTAAEALSRIIIRGIGAKDLV